jgi:transposase InsO family protein
MDWYVGFACGCLVGGWSAAYLRPSDIVRGFADVCRAYWTWKCRRKGGRPKIDAELIALIRRMSFENPTWDAPRIHGELRRLGYRIAQSTVAKYMARSPHRGGQSWKTFLDNHKDAIAAIDMLVVPTIFFERLYVFVVLGLGRRRLLRIEVTDCPTAFWLAGQITEAFPLDTAPEFIVRDNDRAYGAIFRKRLRALGIRDHPTMPHSPWQNGYVERVIGSIRRECLDHVIVVSAAQLRRLLRAYADYYNNDRTHLSLAKDAPNPRPIEVSGRIISRPVLGGLHHRYTRI